MFTLPDGPQCHAAPCGVQACARATMRAAGNSRRAAISNTHQPPHLRRRQSALCSIGCKAEHWVGQRQAAERLVLCMSGLESVAVVGKTDTDLVHAATAEQG